MKSGERTELRLIIAAPPGPFGSAHGTQISRNNGVTRGLPSVVIPGRAFWRETADARRRSIPPN